MEGNTYLPFGDYRRNSQYVDMSSSGSAQLVESHINDLAYQPPSIMNTNQVSSMVNSGLSPNGTQVTPASSNLEDFDWSKVDYGNVQMWSELLDDPATSQDGLLDRPAQTQQNNGADMIVDVNTARHLHNAQAPPFFNANVPHHTQQNQNARPAHPPDTFIYSGKRGHALGPAHSGVIGASGPLQTQRRGQAVVGSASVQPHVSSNRALKKREHDSTSQQVNLQVSKMIPAERTDVSESQDARTTHLSSFRPILARGMSGPLGNFAQGPPFAFASPVSNATQDANTRPAHITMPHTQGLPAQNLAFGSMTLPRPQTSKTDANHAPKAASSLSDKPSSHLNVVATPQHARNLAAQDQRASQKFNGIPKSPAEDERPRKIKKAEPFRQDPRQKPRSSAADPADITGQTSEPRAIAEPSPQAAVFDSTQVSMPQPDHSSQTSPFARIPASRIRSWSTDFTSIADIEAWYASNKEQVETFTVRDDDHQHFDEARILKLASEIYDALLSLPRGPDPSWEERVKRHFYQYQNNALKELCRLMGSDYGRMLAQVHCLRVAQAVVDVHRVGVPESHLLDGYSPTDNWGTDLDLKCSHRAAAVVNVVHAHKWIAVRIAKGEDVAHLVRNPESQLREHLFNIKSNGSKLTNKLPNDPKAPYAVCHINEEELEEDLDHPALAAYRKVKPKKGKPIWKTRSTKKTTTGAIKRPTNFPTAGEEVQLLPNEVTQANVPLEASKKRDRSVPAEAEDDDEVIFVESRPAKRVHLEESLLPHAASDDPATSVPVEDAASIISAESSSTQPALGLQGNPADLLFAGFAPPTDGTTATGQNDSSIEFEQNSWEILGISPGPDEDAWQPWNGEEGPAGSHEW